MWTVPAIEITDTERAELEARVRAHTTPQRMVRRCRIVLLAAEGVPNAKIAEQVGMNHWQVGDWRRRFETERLPGLNDRPRPGRPRLYGHDDRVKIVATVTSTKPDHASQWSYSLLANELADMGISASQIGRILADLDIKPHPVRFWLTRPTILSSGNERRMTAGSTFPVRSTPWCSRLTRIPPSLHDRPSTPACRLPLGSPSARSSSTGVTALPV